MTDKQYDDAILDSNAIDPTDVDGNPIPVTIPIMLAPGVKVVYTMCSPIVWRSPTPSMRN